MPYTVPDLRPTASEEELVSAIQELKDALEAEVKEVTSEKKYDEFRIRWIGRKSGIVQQVKEKWLDPAPFDLKRRRGVALNDVKWTVEEGVKDAKYMFEALAILGHSESDRPDLREAAQKQHLAAQTLDITLPGIRRPLGAEHPVVKTTNEIIGIFAKMGYSVETGPEIETDYYNFESMNFPPNHPARDTQDTIFIAGQESKPQRDRLLLRTHTSPVQTRAMEKHRPPIRVVAPGKVHRSDTPDASHSPIFHQVEGLAVDTNITFSDLKGTLDHAMKELFGSDVKTRFFPSFFPFTEPSADVQVTCFKCGGKGCRLCKMSGWIELLGSGMVDPKVLAFHKDNGYDPEKVSGFAFGMGVERIAMLKYGIDDIQLFFHGDVRFLEQFA